MSEPTASPEAKAKETVRIEAFSDGVFAIAITLLILEIHVPEFKAGETLLHGLSHEWASFLAFLIGFFTLLVCWINHHYMFSMIHRSNSRLLLFNGFKLLVVTVTPFATALLAENIQTDWRQSAVTMYSFNFALMGIAMTTLWLYSAGKGFVSTEPGKLKMINGYYILASVLSISIWAVSYINIICSMILFVFMFVIFVFPETVVTYVVKRSGKEGRK